MNSNNYKNLLSEKPFFTVSDVSEQCIIFIDATKSFMKDYILKVKNQQQLYDVNEIFDLFKNDNERINIGFKKILPNGKYKIGSIESDLIINYRKMNDRFDTIKYKIKYIKLDELNKPHENEKYFKVDQLFTFDNNEINPKIITKITPTMIKYKDCYTKIVKYENQTLGGYQDVKYKILNKEDQNYQGKKEHGIKKTSINLNRFGILEYENEYTVTWDMGQ